MCLLSIQGICGCKTNVTHFTPFSDVSAVEMQMFIRKIEVLSGPRCSFCNFSNELPSASRMDDGAPAGAETPEAADRTMGCVCKGWGWGPEDPGAAPGYSGVLWSTRATLQEPIQNWEASLNFSWFFPSWGKEVRRRNDLSLPSGPAVLAAAGKSCSLAL